MKDAIALHYLVKCSNIGSYIVSPENGWF